LSEITCPSGRKVRHAYDAHGRLSRVYKVKTGQSYATNFTYHGSGAALGFTGGNGVTTTVTLDPRRYRVQTMTAATVPTAPTPELTSGHDTGGNVLTLNDHRAGMNQVFQYDSLDRMKNAVNFEYIAGTFR
jgi:hypothetical protein